MIEGDADEWPGIAAGILEEDRIRQGILEGTNTVSNALVPPTMVLSAITDLRKKCQRLVSPSSRGFGVTGVLTGPLP